ncbi:beta-galactoside alpha-2,6-sialyltransferase 1 isoform X1 [Diorhabda carinulata]|uniref:beta-galactoside alpha-2,6-sialyltransferase 1 isoform X1 n=1 Tax=Diorhabda carinulata TaxID=1163345 RepID=UPI0025A0067D|nr:beta-galactoside alpha-2,6-sialyltransferase 1 isoform X1 [Diorhabda carinulata]XP_057652179.1 beta-galactoside alpha-2,6-sialyltransferase 1 isoform X1 [Diorhabda carinulata]
MRALVVSIWVFINLVFFGMCGYMYLLWSQYWLYMERQAETSTSTYDQQIYFYNRGYYPNNSVATLSSKTRQKHSVLKENSSVTLIKNSKPRFPNLQQKDFELDSKKNMCLKNDSLYICERKTAAFKEDIINELRKVFIEEGNVLRVGKDNPYNVQYRGKRGNFLDKSPKKVLCQLYDVPLKTIKRDDVENHLLKDYIPKRALFQNKRFHSCAVVASAGSLKDSKLGSLIDSHDLVLRFNNAPTEGFEEDVGAKTTIRLLNSQVVTKSQFNFLNWKLFKNVTLVAWDPSNYSSTIEEWLEKPEFNLFPNYIAFRKNDLKSRAFILNPQSVWDIWDFLQDNSPSMLRRNPPSSGFLGIRLLLPFCSFIDVFEYVPSTRVSRRCHYYDPEDNPSCTFGVWHPLAAEKLLTYYINTVDDRTVFQTGYVRIPGLRSVDCT